jgi:hypothetical protein
MEVKYLIKRILNFDKKDWKHILWLLKNSVIQLFKGNLSESKEALYWVKIHICYDSHRVK